MSEAVSNPAPGRMAELWRPIRKILREPLGALGLFLVLFVIFGAVFADLLTSYGTRPKSTRVTGSKAQAQSI